MTLKEIPSTFMLVGKDFLLLIPSNTIQSLDIIRLTYSRIFILDLDKIKEEQICIICREPLRDPSQLPLCAINHFYFCLRCYTPSVLCPVCFTEQKDYCLEDIKELLLKMETKPEIKNEITLSSKVLMDSYCMMNGNGRIILEDIDISSTMLTVFLESFNIEIGVNCRIYEGESSIIKELSSQLWEIRWEGILDGESDGGVNTELAIPLKDELNKPLTMPLKDELIKPLPMPSSTAELNRKYMASLKLSSSSIRLADNIKRVKDREIKITMGWEDVSFYGGSNDIEIYDSFIAILSKLRFPEYNRISNLLLFVTSEEQIRPIIELEDQSIFIGRVTDEITLYSYAINILPKIKIIEENIIKGIRLNSASEEQTKHILEVEDKTIFIGKRINNRMTFYNYSINVVPKLQINEDNILEELYLNNKTKEQVREIIELKDKSIFIGKITKRISLYKYSINIFSKIILNGNNIIERLSLDCDLEDQIENIMKIDEMSISVGRITFGIELNNYAINLISKISIDLDNIMRYISFNGQCFHIVGKTMKLINKSIGLGKVIKTIEIKTNLNCIVDKLIMPECYRIKYS
eukprot:GHVP01029241.1.p1 GENE.GHVP01029241.1~~GHVP01029241.1.p1  ORF type:complete len:580 (-),score=77.00 GHVP01029241.1:294-2033(-)